MGTYSYKTDDRELAKKEYLINVTWYYNLPSFQHNKKIVVEAYNSYDAIDKIYRAYPNIQNCTISENMGG